MSFTIQPLFAAAALRQSQSTASAAVPAISLTCRYSRMSCGKAPYRGCVPAAARAEALYVCKADAAAL
eukprot:159466-Heterocapsa_arctica.AAC.1